MVVVVVLFMVFLLGLDQEFLYSYVLRSLYVWFNRQDLPSTISCDLESLSLWDGIGVREFMRSCIIVSNPFWMRMEFLVPIKYALPG